MMKKYKLMKRILSIALCLVMAFSTLPARAETAEVSMDGTTVADAEANDGTSITVYLTGDNDWLYGKSGEIEIGKQAPLQKVLRCILPAEL